MAKDKFSQEEIDELEKSLQSIGMPEDEISKAITMAKEKLEPKEDEEDDDEVEKAYRGKVDEMEKTIKGFSNELGDIKKAIEDMKGLLPGSPAKVTTDLGKGEEDELEKGEKTDLEKGGDDIAKSFDTIEKSLGESLGNLITEKLGEISKGFETELGTIKKEVQKIAEAPNPFRGFAGNYNNNVIQKGIEKNEEGQEVFSKSMHKSQILGKMWQVADKKEGKDKMEFMKSITSFENTGKLNEEVENLLKSELNIEIEK